MQLRFSKKLVFDNIFLYLLFPLSVFVDLLNGYLQYEKDIHSPIGIIYRGGILLFLIGCFLKSQITKFVIYVWCVLLLSILALLYWIQSPSFIFSIELENFIKILYFILLPIYFINVQGNVSKNRLFVIISNYGFLISVCLIVSLLTGLGIPCYGEDYGWGTKSYFYAGNDLGLTLLFSLIFTQLLFFRQLTWWSLIRLSCMLFSCFILGSRVGMVGSVFLCLVTVFYYILFHKCHSFNGKLIKSIIVFLILPLIIFGLTVSLVELYNSFDSFTLRRLTLEGILSARDVLIEAAKVHIDKFDGGAMFFGEGMSSLYSQAARYLSTDVDFRAIEADLYEIVGGYGYGLGLLILSFPVCFAIKAMIRYLHEKSLMNYAFCFVFGAFVIVGFSAGHAVKNVMVAPIYAITISLFVKR